jgi:hypothetical protein
VDEIGELVRRWPGIRAPGIWDRIRYRDSADDKALEAVFESLGRVCVQHLVAVPHPFGLPPRDRLVAQRWLLRRAWARHWRQDLVIVLALVGLGLAAAFLILDFYPAATPASDAVQRSAPIASLRG